jgi:type IV pilus assembly protein PilM
MQIFPKTLGSRPRLAVELRAEGVVAARAEDAAALLLAVSEADLPPGSLQVSLTAANLADRERVIAALRKTLDAVSNRTGGDRGRAVTLIVPDSAARVLLLDFDSVPSKPAEAVAVIRFRLKKLLPFDSDQAALSYQIMSNAKNVVRVLVVAMPQTVLGEYEQAIVAAGYQPGAVLPSTLAALSALDEHQSSALLVNAGHGGITTAIVHSGVLLLHRSLELAEDHHERESASELEARVFASAEAEMRGREIAQTVSVAAAYFEDTLNHSPEIMYSAGILGADTLHRILEENGFEGADVRELVRPEDLAAGVSSSARSRLAGVRGALKN